MMRPQELRSRLRGVIVILVTPFKDDFSLDVEGFRANLSLLIDSGIETGKGAVVVGGSMSECYAMSIDEQARLFKVAVDEAAGRVPVICGSSSTATHLAVELAQSAEEAGADGIMLLPPYYHIPPNEETILRHFKTVADAIDIGIMIYNNMYITGIDLSIDLISKIAESRNVVALKQSSPDFFQLRRAVERLGKRLSVLSGFAEWWEPYGSMVGSAGIVSGLANWAPGISLELVEASTSGDLKRAQAIYTRMVPHLELISTVGRELGTDGCVALYHAALDMIGRAAGPPRPPVGTLPEKWIPGLRSSLAGMGVL